MVVSGFWAKKTIKVHLFSSLWSIALLLFCTSFTHFPSLSRCILLYARLRLFYAWTWTTVDDGQWYVYSPKTIQLYRNYVLFFSCTKLIFALLFQKTLSFSKKSIKYLIKYDLLCNTDDEDSRPTSWSIRFITSISSWIVYLGRARFISHALSVSLSHLC